MKQKVEDRRPAAIRKAEFRFTVVGPLLSSPPEYGQLIVELKSLANKIWKDPISGENRKFSVATIWNWYNVAKKTNQSPLANLKTKNRVDLGSLRVLNENLIEKWHDLYKKHPHWNLQLLYDNFKAWGEQQTPVQPVPSYSTFRRLCHKNGWLRMRKPVSRPDGSFLPSSVAAIARKTGIEVRSYEAEFIGGLWHLDFHNGSLPILLENGKWIKPVLLAIIDDASRLICHAQWYLDENSENLIHGFSQAILKRGLPRALMTDNGKPMESEEFKSGLMGLGIVLENTLKYSPYQNGKIEKFWALIEGRLLPMLEDVRPLTLKKLNDYTQVWVEAEYNQFLHSEIEATPSQKFLKCKNVLREAPKSEVLKKLFVRTVRRKQRKSDGTFTLNGVRYEVTSAYRHHTELWIQYVEWDLSFVYLADPRNQEPVAQLLPIDKLKNANGKRAAHAKIAPANPISNEAETFQQLPPQMQNLVKQRNQAGFHPAYIPQSKKQ